MKYARVGLSGLQTDYILGETNVNDYDIDYFDSRIIIDDNALYDLTNNDNFDCEEFIKSLEADKANYIDKYNERFKKFNFGNPIFAGDIDEVTLLIKICKQNYESTNCNNILAI